MTSAEKIPLDDWFAERGIRDVQLGATNLEGSFIGKTFAPAVFSSGRERGFTFADVAFGLDLGNKPVLGFDMPRWRSELGDILLHPDLTTLVEWEPGRAAVLGEFTTVSGEPLAVCPRTLLRKQVSEIAQLGFTARVAIEIELTVFEESIREARLKGYRDLTPLGGTCGSVFHLAKERSWNSYATAVTRRLDELGIAWEAWNDEAASGQLELNLAPTDPISAADNWARTRQVLREVADEQGHCVTFMAKCSDEYGQGSHLNISLERDGSNAFYAPDGPSPTMSAFLGGVMATMQATSSFALPFITSYRRLHDLDGPPTTCTWGVSNKTVAVRAMIDLPKQARLEYRIPGSDTNVYLALAAVLVSGMLGIKNAMSPPPETTVMGWGLVDSVPLPNTISKAFDAIDRDQLLRTALGDELIDYWIGTKRWEWMRFHTSGNTMEDGVSDWELRRYFELP